MGLSSAAQSWGAEQIFLKTGLESKLVHGRTYSEEDQRESETLGPVIRNQHDHRR